MDVRPQYFPLTIPDYLLGLSDLTGELMRFAISGISRKGGRQKALKVCAFVRACKAGALFKLDAHTVPQATYLFHLYHISY